MERCRKKNDLILIGVILAAAVLIFVYSLLTRTGGAYAVVTVDGEEIGRYRLDEPFETEIVTDLGRNILVIADGKARVTEADCPDGLCVSQKDICYEGETIVCLPHRLIVTIEGGLTGEIDGIVE